VRAFHGVELNSLARDGVRYRTSDFPPGFTTSAHAHEEAYFCLVVDGVSAQRSGKRECVRERGQVYFYPSGEVQNERFGCRGSRLFSVEIGPEALARMDGTVRLPRESGELSGLAALIVRRLHLASDREEDLALEGLTVVLLSTLAQERSGTIRWGPVVRDFLHAHFTERLTLGRVARIARVHPVHLCRDFPRRFGVTMGEYLRALRVDWAARQLAGTDRPIADIALDAGFASQAHLTRELKRSLGTTPAAYRRR